MNDKLILGLPGSIMTVLVAALAAVIAISMLTAIVGLFQSHGAPLQHLARAERACASHAYQSEREACMKQWLADSDATKVAKQ